ncbi:hypothetical protein [Microcoleus sp.]|uniref:hypothetical protein n=1 Tax=Microcoleus sp. TaxID=44472 RepID=UPI003C742D19
MDFPSTCDSNGKDNFDAAAIISKKLNLYLECMSKELVQNYNLTSLEPETLGGQTTCD